MSVQEQFWVERARQGDPQAFAKLVELYQRPIYNLAYRMLGSAEEAEDATQETFLRVYTRLNTYDPSKKFSSWILSVASHYCIDRLRRRRLNVVSAEEVQTWRWLPGDAPKPEEEALAREREMCIQQLLEALPPQYRLVIVLRYWEDLSYEEIAEATSSTISAVKARLHRARRAMAEIISRSDVAPERISLTKRRAPENAMSGSF